MVKVKNKDFPMSRLKYRGYFDWGKLYKTLQAWFEMEGYEFHETSVKHKVPTPVGSELEVSWNGWRKITGYIKYWIYVDFHLWDLREEEVMRDGKKVRLSYARLEIEMHPELEMDYQGRFDGSRFMIILQDFMHKYVMRKVISGYYEDQLYYLQLKLFTLAKETLDMEAIHNASVLRY